MRLLYTANLEIVAKAFVDGFMAAKPYAVLVIKHTGTSYMVYGPSIEPQTPDLEAEARKQALEAYSRAISG